MKRWLGVALLGLIILATGIIVGFIVEAAYSPPAVVTWLILAFDVTGFAAIVGGLMGAAVRIIRS